MSKFKKPEPCSDHGCVIAKRTGMGTNGGCHCVPSIGRKMFPEDRRRILEALGWYRQQVEELEKHLNSAGDAPAKSTKKDIKSKSKKRASSLGSWTASAEHHKLARELGQNINLEYEKFCDYAAANGKTYKDWDAAFRNWLRNAAKWIGRNSANCVKPS